MLKASLHRSAHSFFLCLLPCLGLVGCASTLEKPPEVADVLPSTSSPVSDTRRIAELERQLAERQRQCAEDKRQQDMLLKQSQLSTEQLQKKLDALLAIDRELRSRGKGR